MQLPFDRILILLTKIDLLCERIAATLRREAETFLDQSLELAMVLPSFKGIREADVPELLDVVAMVETRTTGFWNLAASLKPGGRLAVGVLSTAGLPREETDRQASNPYGVKEALLFALRGELSIPFRELPVQDLERSRPSQYTLKLDLPQGSTTTNATT